MYCRSNASQRHQNRAHFKGLEMCNLKSLEPVPELCCIHVDTQQTVVPPSPPSSPMVRVCITFLVLPAFLHISAFPVSVLRKYHSSVSPKLNHRRLLLSTVVRSFRPYL